MMWFDVSRSSGTEFFLRKKQNKTKKQFLSPSGPPTKNEQVREIKMPFGLTVNIYRAVSEEITENVRNCPATA